MQGSASGGRCWLFFFPHEMLPCFEARIGGGEGRVTGRAGPAVHGEPERRDAGSSVGVGDQDRSCY